MFNKLKNKFKETISSFKKEVEEETDNPDEGEVFSENIEEETNETKSSDNLDLDENETTPEPSKEQAIKFSERLTTKKLDQDRFEEIFFELELNMLQNNVAQDTVDAIKESLQTQLVGQRFSRTKIESKVTEAFKKTIEDILPETPTEFIKIIKTQKPYIIVVLGTNGTGKTTTIAKIANYLQKNNQQVVVAAADTFRAGAIAQISKHGDNLNFTVIKHKDKSDPSAVAYDAVSHAKSKNKDVVIIDTAGRLHTNDNLMQELQKIIKVTKPHMKLFIGESTTGNDCTEQARTYNKKVRIDGIILTKTDADEKGGTALSISQISNAPIHFYGTGQGYDDLKQYKKDETIKNLGL